MNTLLTVPLQQWVHLGIIAILILSLIIQINMFKKSQKKFIHELEVRDAIYAGQLKRIQQALRDQKDENRKKALNTAIVFSEKHGGTFALVMEYAEQIYKFYGSKSL